MRSTLLFVAVLLACTPMHAQATAPEEAQISITWLAALFPAPTAETTRRIVIQRKAAVRPAYPRISTTLVQAAPDKPALTPLALALLHDPNAP